MYHGLRNRRRTASFMVGMAGLASLWACDGQNVFSPGGIASDALGPTVEIETPREPAARPVGDSVLIQAHMFDDVGVDSVLFAGISYRGDLNLGTDTIVERYQSKMVRFGATVGDTTVSRYLMATPDTTREGSVLLAIAYDSGGNLSADTVSMTIGGPRVTFLTLEDDLKVQSGLSLNLQVEAADPEGVLDMEIRITGAFEKLIEIPFAPPPTYVLVDTVVLIPEGITGTVEVTASARNGLAVSGQDGPIELEVVDFEIGDETPPSLTIGVASTERLELDDAITVMVTGADDTQGAGIARAGYTVKAISPRRGDTLVQSGEKAYSPARTGNLSASFQFLPFNVDELALPDSLVFEVTGWAVDGDGNCAAAVEEGVMQSIPCEALPGGQTAAEGRVGFRLPRVMTTGRTVDLPSGGKIMDAVADTLRRNLFLSNIETNRVEVFSLDEEKFKTAIGVGSEPWGLSLDRSGDRLLVANSGASGNVTSVDLNDNSEIENERFFAPDAVIFDLELEVGDAGSQFRVHPFPSPAPPSFSDRPQYIAVDSFGNFIFSTRTTSFGDIGTARKAYRPEGAEQTETKLFVEHGLNEIVDDFWAFAHIDSIGVGFDEVAPGIFFSGLTLFDHVPGFPTNVIQATANTSETEPVTNAVGRLNAQGSDVYVQSSARWNIPGFGFADTTFVSASGDGGWVIIGEGGIGPEGRVMMYRASQADTTRLSSTMRVWDQVINSADRVNGVGLNYDGTLGVARGMSAYFFDSELQLNGRVELPGAAEGTGAALHPLHANQLTGQNPNPIGEYRPDTHIAFVGTGNGTIDIIDTFHFTRIGQVTLRDVISGPLRAILPFPEDNAGLSCPTLPVLDQVGNSIGNATQLYTGGNFDLPIPPDGITDDSCIVVKLFAITSAGGVVVVPVRKSEILKYHPRTSAQG
jgi:DNA-binding beta-propeller fold protein YncE